MLELALLGLLKERPMHGYDLRKRLREDFGLLSNLSFGSLYPALARLESAGAVRAAGTGTTTGVPVLADPAATPLTGSLSGERAAYRLSRTRASETATGGPAARGTRGRKVYEITPAGETMFDRLLAPTDEAMEDARSFSLRLAFARHLSPPNRLRLLERRRSQLADRLSKTERSMTASTRSLDTYERSLVEHSTESTRRDISWLDRLIAAEQAFALGATAPQGRND
ncbi:MAG TPA: helix-turn-helix transcriptional regulator [Acidimicrobiales bacterium]|nr:helix-turn-helix transcriptional regulator [Acidimicrobiales bacterium]